MPAMLLGSAGMEFVFTIPDAKESVRSATGDSVSYQIEDMRISCDSVQLDAALMDQYSNSLLSGSSIIISYKAWDFSMQHLLGNAGSWTLNSAKQYTRLNNMFVTLDKDTTPNQGGLEGIRLSHINRFWLGKASSEDVESFIQLNNVRFPDFNNRGRAEHFNRLHRGIGLASSVAHSLNISESSWGNKDTDANSWVFVSIWRKALHTLESIQEKT